MSKAQLFSTIGNKISNIGKKFKNIKETLPSKEDLHNHADIWKKNIISKLNDHREGLVGAGAATGAYNIGAHNGYEDGKLDGFKEASSHLLRQAMMKEDVDNDDLFVNEIKPYIKCGLASVFNKKIK